ncbi:MAG: SRPBCC domain-containing protein [Bacteroidota bacterium]
MDLKEKKVITVTAGVSAPVDKVWKFWTLPIHIQQWNHASPDWHCPHAENDLREGGRFRYTMAARDGSVSFDFTGGYQKVVENKSIEYIIDDGRLVHIRFEEDGDKTLVTEHFEAEELHSPELQQTGWQAILDNFAEYAGSRKKTTIRFQVDINAPADKVYQQLIDDQGYREWTAVFNPTSHFVGTWEKDTEMLFVGHDENGVMHGMVSKIRENIPGKTIIMEHLRAYRTGENPNVDLDPWSGFFESYHLSEKGPSTVFMVETDTTPDFLDYFLVTWPKALAILKEMCEK